MVTVICATVVTYSLGYVTLLSFTAQKDPLVNFSWDNRYPQLKSKASSWPFTSQSYSRPHFSWLILLISITIEPSTPWVLPLPITRKRAFHHDSSDCTDSEPFSSKKRKRLRALKIYSTKNNSHYDFALNSSSESNRL